MMLAAPGPSPRTVGLPAPGAAGAPEAEDAAWVEESMVEMAKAINGMVEGDIMSALWF